MYSASVVRRWAIGFVVGLAAGVAIIGGPLSLVLVFAAIVLVGREPRRAAPMGGLFIGFGIAWVTVLGLAAARCGDGCVGPDLRPWLVVAGASLLLGSALSGQAYRTRDR